MILMKIRASGGPSKKLGGDSKKVGGNSKSVGGNSKAPSPLLPLIEESGHDCNLAEHKWEEPRRAAGGTIGHC